MPQLPGWRMQAVLVLCMLHCAAHLPTGCHARWLHKQPGPLHAVLQQQLHAWQQQLMDAPRAASGSTEQAAAGLLQAAAAAAAAVCVHGIPATSSSSSSSSVHGPQAPLPPLQQHTQQQSRRALLQYRPSQDERHAATQHAGRVSGRHVAGVAVLSLLAMAALGAIGYKAMQWYERTRRPGYVELQALDNTFHRPTFTL